MQAIATSYLDMSWVQRLQSFAVVPLCNVITGNATMHLQ